MQNVNVIDSNASVIPKESRKASIFSWLRFVILLIVIYALLHYGMAFKIVSGHSMNPTLHNKGFMVVNKLYFKPERGDIVIVKDPNGFDIVKRIIGLPNDSISIKNGIVFVNGKPINENYTEGKANDMKAVALDNKSYFIMGDNRTPGESLDSRDPSIGPVSNDKIEGEVILH
ncbi:signal peptidase I [Heyndrickxia camelliae]|uniref:Signal peptidase I n=1 Tax=Heyndrickxia camelliae TaxID=1707093 RepID=A0A2N3LJI0_9BACI|nr:signal peptidase I [Heyndrickxia camelliae]PKR84699.1 signal peptidase I [Heyndrickxia camelliae]